MINFYEKFIKVNYKHENNIFLNDFLYIKTFTSFKIDYHLTSKLTSFVINYFDLQLTIRKATHIKSLQGNKQKYNNQGSTIKSEGD